jgi:Protein of unknown function (DUF1153)
MTADASTADSRRAGAKSRRSDRKSPCLDFAMVMPLAKGVRWVPSRKARLVEAVRRGRMSLSEACEIYALSLEEFTSWKKALENEGLRGLRARALSRG